MSGRLIEDARELVRCRPVAIRIAGRQGDDLLLGGGSDSGLKVGDLLRVGGPTVHASESLDWPMSPVVSLYVSTSRARLFDPAGRGDTWHVTTRMTKGSPFADWRRSL